MAMEVEPDLALLEDVYDRRWEKLSIMKHALAAYHSDQVHRKEPKSDTKLKALVTDMLEDSATKNSYVSKRQRSRKKTGHAQSFLPTKVTERQAIADSGASKGSCSGGTKCAFKRVDQNRRKG